MLKKSIELTILVLVLIFSFFDSIGQTRKQDSLKILFENEKNDSLKVLAGLVYFNEVGGTNLAEAESGLRQLIDFSVKRDVNTLSPRIRTQLGNLYYDHGRYLNSIVTCEQALIEFNKLDQTSETLSWSAWAYMWTGLSYSLINDWENAQQKLNLSLEYSERASDSCLVANTSMNLAYIYFDMRDWLGMQRTLNKGMPFLTGCANKDTRIMVLSSMAVAYAKTKQIEEGLLYVNQVKEILRQEPKARLNAFYYYALGELRLAEGNALRAVEAFEQGLRIAESWSDPYYKAILYERLGVSYEKRGERANAKKYLQQAFQVTNENSFMVQRRNVLQSLAEHYSNEGNFERAYKYASYLIQLGDSLNTKINSNRRLLLEATYDASKRESIISKLESQKESQQSVIVRQTTLNFALAALVIIIILMSLLVLRTYQQRQLIQRRRIVELETEKQLTASKAVIQGEEQERSRLAKDLHDGLGGLLSGVKISLSNMKSNLAMTGDNVLTFERSLDMLDNSIQELRRVSHNMMPESLMKFGLPEALRDFCESINSMKALDVQFQLVGEVRRIDSSQEIIVYRVVQELLNNTLKHSGAKSSIVQLMFEPHSLSITVEDDGRGFEKSVLEKSTGSGWPNIQSRVDYLKGKLDVITKPGEGTSVHIRLLV